MPSNGNQTGEWQWPVCVYKWGWGWGAYDPWTGGSVHKLESQGKWEKLQEAQQRIDTA